MKPKRLNIQFATIPLDLVKRDNWIVWKWVERDGRWTKPPYQVNGAPAKSNDPQTWVSYVDVIEAYETDKWDGIGFMLDGDHVGIDWDDIRNPESGEIDEGFLAKIKYIDSYSEISPSGAGVKTLLTGKLPRKGHHEDRVGVFMTGRYFCITGNILSGCSLDIEPRQKQLNSLIKRYWPQDFEALSKRPAGKPDDAVISQEHLQVLLKKALASKGTKFKQLWDGDFTEYASQSEADMALCNMLSFWTNKNYAAIDSLFRESGLMRDKWDRSDYRNRTIDNAIKNTQDGYKGNSDGSHNKSNLYENLSDHDLAMVEMAEERACIQAEAVEAEKKSTINSPVKKEYIDMLGEEEWLFENIIIKNQITTIIAKSGGGKTTICYDFISPHILNNHPKVDIVYLDCDSPASDHARLYDKGEEHGDRFCWNNPLTRGESPDQPIKQLENMIKQRQVLEYKVIFMDTLKKFVDVMNKKDTKKFYGMLRHLTSLGATIVLLGHANKYRDGEGLLVYEGVGDVQNDVDALIFFERMDAIGGGIDVTTIVDINKGAKVRGLYEPVSFHIERGGDREVTQNAEIIPVPDYTPKGKKERLSDDEIKDAIIEFLRKKEGRVNQSDIVAALKDKTGIGYNHLLSMIKAHGVPFEDAVTPGTIFYTVGQHNQKWYDVTD